jgi:two-component system, sensor histidine kinase PdtaS
VSNALKHGYTQGRGGQITVAVQQHGERTIELTVSNDGHGIPASLDLEQTTTLGLQLVQLLTRQLNGTMEIQRENPTRFTLRFELEGDS